jgi:hypothetical protein
MHLHFLVTEGGTDEAAVSPVLMNWKRFMSAGVFHEILRIDDLRLAEIFAREVLVMLVRKELLSPKWAERIFSWRHSGFSVHSLVRAKTRPEAERVGKHMVRPILALERLTLLEDDVRDGEAPTRGRSSGASLGGRPSGRVCSLIVELGGEVCPDRRLAAAGIGRPGRPGPFIGRRRRA